MALSRHACPSAPVTWPRYFSTVLNRVDRGDADEGEKDRPEAALFVPVGKSNEKGMVTKTSELMSERGIVKSRVVAMPNNCFLSKI